MRSPLIFEVKDSNGNVLPNAAVTIRDRVTGVPVNLYETETAFLPDTNPTIADSTGRVVTWAERGDYTATVTGTGITAYTMPLDSTPANDASVDSSWMTTFPYRAIYNAAAETTTSTTYTELTTPDTITDVTIPANSFVGIGAMFLSKATTTTLASATIFANGQKLKAINGTGVVTENIVSAGNNTSANIYSICVLGSSGWQVSMASVDYAVETATGMAYDTSGSAQTGGLLWCWVPDAGLYDFSMQFQAAAAQTLTVKERHLIIWVIG